MLFTGDGSRREIVVPLTTSEFCIATDAADARRGCRTSMRRWPSTHPHDSLADGLKVRVIVIRSLLEDRAAVVDISFPESVIVRRADFDSVFVLVKLHVFWRATVDDHWSVVDFV